ncbi:hypothetical protein [Cupriavidus gilardii]|uniref:hypothetical protein n=1 Tax=Cupriavidus gilardii TaxID=82541 RepID=UPI0021C0CC51|nr:hypothetical protein [Cupriavidus gilardii]MCT9125375.1 hypothetical protein [Cupriavidus gilardii]
MTPQWTDAGLARLLNDVKEIGMEQIKDGGPAFPAKVSVNRDSGELLPYQFDRDGFCTPGLSLRDYFAAKAMQGALAYPGTSISSNRVEEYAQFAYAVADEMLAAREGK